MAREAEPANTDRRAMPRREVLVAAQGDGSTLRAGHIFDLEVCAVYEVVAGATRRRAVCRRTRLPRVEGRARRWPRRQTQQGDERGRSECSPHGPDSNAA